MSTQALASNKSARESSGKPIHPKSVCPECHGTGWVFVVCTRGHESVARCGECGVRRRTCNPVLPDFKSLAAGDR